MRTGRLFAALAYAPALVSSPARAEPFDAEGYRNASYRAPVDRDPAPARPITAAEARRLHPGRTALFLDVLPAEGARRDPDSGLWALAEPHQTIPGAQWYPETGRSPVAPTLWDALAARVSTFRSRHPAAPVVVFCRADCWMSWNAARRLALAGVRGVRWFADGIEGWHKAGGVLVTAEPVPVPDPPGALAQVSTTHQGES